MRSNNKKKLNKQLQDPRNEIYIVETSENIGPKELMESIKNKIQQVLAKE